MTYFALNNLNNKFLDQPGGRLEARTSSPVNQICAPTSFDNLGLVLFEGMPNALKELPDWVKAYMCSSAGRKHRVCTKLLDVK
ncbi:hypothetical protein FS837_005634 [Tulasnella sp. UAMH 9824]|nr:hypothetical protein FS837_005634 [Tulasnella sp. UAMH 9824]